MRRKNTTYPKDGEQKLRDAVQKLRVQVGRLRKENRTLRDELSNIIKPVRPRKAHVKQKSPEKMTQDEWRNDFIKKYKPKIEKCLKETEDE